MVGLQGNCELNRGQHPTPSGGPFGPCGKGGPGGWVKQATTLYCGPTILVTSSIFTYLRFGIERPRLTTIRRSSKGDYVAIFHALVGGQPGSHPEHTFFLQEQHGESLSTRELEALRLVDQGLTHAEITARLVVAASAVKTHIYNIYGMLMVQTHGQAINRARELGLLNLIYPAGSERSAWMAASV